MRVRVRVGVGVMVRVGVRVRVMVAVVGDAVAEVARGQRLEADEAVEHVEAEGRDLVRV